MNSKQVELWIKNHIKEKTGYDYDVMIISVDDNTRLLIHTEDQAKEEYKEKTILFFTSLINSASVYRWARLDGESNWLLLSDSEENT